MPYASSVRMRKGQRQLVALGARGAIHSKSLAAISIHNVGYYDVTGSQLQLLVRLAAGASTCASLIQDVYIRVGKINIHIAGLLQQVLTPAQPRLGVEAHDKNALLVASFDAYEIMHCCQALLQQLVEPDSSAGVCAHFAP